MCATENVREGEIKNHVQAILRLLRKAVNKNDLNFRETSTQFFFSRSRLCTFVRVVHTALGDSAHNLHKIFKKAHST